VRLSVITDEIAPELRRALDVCEELGISAVELRMVDSVQVVNVPAEELVAMRKELDRRGFTVSAIASPFLNTGASPIPPRCCRSSARRCARLCGRA
jgi:L-ribulose-5-phosphate 3-epimerase